MLKCLKRNFVHPATTLWQTLALSALISLNSVTLTMSVTSTASHFLSISTVSTHTHAPMHQQHHSTTTNSIPSITYQPHRHARSNNPSYPHRQAVTDQLVSWSVTPPDYHPPAFTAESVLKHSLEPRNAADIQNWHQRESHFKPLLFDALKRPRNPMGRTGLADRGKLYNFGANLAADCLVMRRRVSHTAADQHAEIQFIAILRRDTNQLAIVGGFVDSMESTLQAAQREFKEEAIGKAAAKQTQIVSLLERVFSSPSQIVFSGYVDDPRNTDNAWIESRVHCFLIDWQLGDELSKYLKGSDDALDAFWVNAKANQPMYANHREIVELAVQAIQHGSFG